MNVDCGKDFKQEETTKKTEEVNEARCEFLRTLKMLEKSLHAQLLANESKELDQAYVDLERRVVGFRNTVVSQEDDLNEAEDTYVQLALEIREMTNREESKLIDGQTIFYVSSGHKNQLGNLVHLTGVYLTQEEIDCLR